MMPESRFWNRPRSRRSALILATACAAACVDEATAPESSSPPPSRAPRVLGFVELTFSGIGTPEMSSYMRVAPTIDALEALRARHERSDELRDVVTHDLTLPANADSTGNATIQLALDSRDEFVLDGTRYLHATFNVRNAQLDSTAYDTERTNLTFLGVSTSNTIDQTAVRVLQLGGGTPADPGLALQVLPTGLVAVDGDSLNAVHPDVLQILTEAEVAAVPAPAGVTSVFPYGFVVRNATDNTTRTLPASPAAGQFDGVVDFAFQMPEEAQTLSVLMLAVDDSEIRLTQSLQERTPAARDSLLQRADSLGAGFVTVLPGGGLIGFGVLTVCSVRTAGPSSAATAHLVNVDWTLQSFSPTPGTSIAANAQLGATFSAAPDDFGPESFTVRGLQSGPAFLQGPAYTISGTTISTPAGSFFTGEEVEVALTTALSCPQPQVTRYRVQGGGTGSFNPDTTYDMQSNPESLAIGDLDGMNGPDIAVANASPDGVLVLLNNGDGTFPTTGNPTYGAGNGPQSVAIGDLNDDGNLDLAVVNITSGNVSVLLNNDNGTFPTTGNPTYSAGSRPASVAIGDLDGDGSLDLAVANEGSGNVSVFLNNGDGTFPTDTTYGTGAQPLSVAIGDLNGDGSLDLATANFGSANVSVLLNNRDGTFPTGNPTYNVGQGPQSVAIGDLDGMNGPDLAVANGPTDSVSVLLNNGSGTFPTTGNPTYLAGSYPYSVAIGDLDGINGLDLAVTNFSSDNLSILLNDGNGTFPTMGNPTHGTGIEPVSIVIGNLNGNGSLDLATANQGSGNVSVLLGQVP